jgi:hypothetical protein
MNILTVCLPDVDDHGRLCQPFAAEWLRIGMPIYKAFGPQKCESFDLEAIHRWTAKIKHSSVTPFINNEHLDMFLRKKPNGSSVKTCLKDVLPRQPGVLRYSKCAFVGSGKLRRKGNEIDSYDAVFRANTHIHNFSKFQDVAGTRMDYVANCLFNGHVPPNVKNCIVPSSWWNRRAGSESWNNSPNELGGPRIRSDWSCAKLNKLSQKQNFIFHKFHLSGVRSIDTQLQGSGGTSFHAALSMCRRVHVYGVGMTNWGLNDSKVYQHYYDPYDKPCQAESKKISQKSWLRDRVSSEIIYHLLHLLGLITLS